MTAFAGKGQKVLVVGLDLSLPVHPLMRFHASFRLESKGLCFVLDLSNELRDGSLVRVNFALSQTALDQIDQEFERRIFQLFQVASPPLHTSDKALPFRGGSIGQDSLVVNGIFDAKDGMLC